MELTKQLLLYLVDQLQDQNGMISKIRIVKLLYLIDVEHYRMYGKTLTNLNWEYYLYGPYTFSIDQAIHNAGLDLGQEEVVINEGRISYIYSTDTPQDLEDIVKFPVKAMIDREIKQWAYEDTEFLLDYVYYHTEPMKVASFGQALDFSTVQRNLPLTVQPIKLSFDKSTKIQELLQKRRNERKSPVLEQDRYDDLYFEALHVMDGEDFIEIPAGSVVVTPEGEQSMRKQLSNSDR